MLKYLIPLALFLILSVFLFKGLWLNPQEVPSPLIGKPAPAFTLPQLHQTGQSFSLDQMKGEVWLFNVWASWCVSCRVEHPLLVQLSRTGQIPIYGLNYKDNRADALRWLQADGDPYSLSVMDVDGRVGIDFGVYGVPETYLIDKNGLIAHKVTGPVNLDNLRNCVLPLAELLQKASADQQPTREAVPACV